MSSSDIIEYVGTAVLICGLYLTEKYQREERSAVKTNIVRSACVRIQYMVIG